MASSVLETTVTDRPNSRVHVQVTVPAAEIDRRLDGKARELGRDLRLPGFRKGKVPAALVLGRIGREAVLDEAVRSALSGWYVGVVATEGLDVVGDPEIDLGELPAPGEPYEFSFEVGVVPTATLGQYKGLEVGRREAAVEDQRIDQEIEGLRERLARLQTVERPAQTGDFVVIDYVGRLVVGSADDGGEDEIGEPFPGGGGHDQLVELGGGNLIPGFEEGLVGAQAGETRAVRVTFPDSYPANEQLAGQAASFEVVVKEVKLKELPEVDDDLAIEAGFDDVAQLRGDIHTRLLDDEQARIAGEFREAVLDAVVAAATIEVHEDLPRARAREMWERMIHALSHRGISREAYMSISGRDDEEQIVAEMVPEAEQALRREAVIAAVVAAEGIEASEEDLEEALQTIADREGVATESLLDDLRGAGRLQEIRDDLAARRAIELLAEEARPIPMEQVEARERLWTPESDVPATAAENAPGAAQAGLWTPDR